MTGISVYKRAAFDSANMQLLLDMIAKTLLLVFNGGNGWRQGVGEDKVRG